jgi:hypothetical protein
MLLEISSVAYSDNYEDDITALLWENAGFLILQQVIM